MIKVISIEDNPPEGTIIRGLVPAKCVVNYHKVVIKVRGSKLIDSKCSCGNTLCSHAIKLYLFYVSHIKATINKNRNILNDNCGSRENS